MLERAMNAYLGLLLSPATASQYLKLRKGVSDLGFYLTHTVCLGFFEMGSILARTWPGRLRAFQYLGCFQIETWCLVFATIAILSVISSIKFKDAKLIHEYAWNYFNLLFQKSFQKFILKANQNYFLLIWVISTLFLSIFFCADILDSMVRAQPIIKIDSLEQLAESKLKIIARKDSALAEFANEHSKEYELANKLQPLLELYKNKDPVEKRTIR